MSHLESALKVDLQAELDTLRRENRGLRELVAELDAYWAWVDKENSGHVVLAHSHGWCCPQDVIDKGTEWRAKIAALRAQALTAVAKDGGRG